MVEGIGISMEKQGMELKKGNRVVPASNIIWLSYGECG